MAIRSKGPNVNAPPTYPKPDAPPSPPPARSGGYQPERGPERPSNPPQGSGMPRTPTPPTGGSAVPSLINTARRQQLAQPEARGITLDDLDVGQLIELREQIEQRLPATLLANLNLEKELVIQFLAIKSMLSKIVDDDKTPANQRAQVANSVTSILGDMTKMQNAVYNSERVKKLEAAMIKALEVLPLETRQLFLDSYEDIYNRA
jgi:hypothetical protein